MREFVMGENEGGQRLDKYLGKLLPEAPKSFYYKMLRKKNITLNGKKAVGNEKLAFGDVVKLFFSEETFLKFSGEKPAFAPVRHKLSILYEDRHVVLVNKPAGMLSQKSRESEVSLVEHLISYLLESGSLSEAELATFRPSVCNRLDRNTSGIVACGKSLAGLQELSALFRERSLKKFYCCLAAGRIREKKLIQGYLHKDTSCNKVVVLKHPRGQAAPIWTEYEPIGGNGRVTALKVRLITGKSHQIRSHLSSAGHPIVGDGKYGDFGINALYREKYGVSHQLLHAACLEFPKLEGVLEPLSEKRMTAPLPAVFRDVLDKELTGENWDENLERNLGIRQADPHCGGCGGHRQ